MARQNVSPQREHSASPECPAREDVTEAEETGYALSPFFEPRVFITPQLLRNRGLKHTFFSLPPESPECPAHEDVGEGAHFSSLRSPSLHGR